MYGHMLGACALLGVSWVTGDFWVPLGQVQAFTPVTLRVGALEGQQDLFPGKGERWQSPCQVRSRRGERGFPSQSCF